MYVKDICTWKPSSCFHDSTLADAARLMWDGDCGSVPIVDRDGKVVGMISDRDITMAAVTKDRAPRSIAVREVMTGRVFSCRAEDEIHAALRLMAEKRVRRLPVVDAEGRLQGILSVSDCIRHAKPALQEAEQAVPTAELLAALQALSTPWREFFGVSATKPAA